MRIAVLALVAFCLLAPGARADGFEALQDLAKRHLKPAPLVPTTAPSPLSDLGATLTTAPAIRKGGYGLRLVHYTSSGPDAIIALARGDYASMAAALRSFRRDGYKKRSTRIRGKHAYLLTRSRELLIAWSEEGRVFTIATGTPRKVSVSALRATAAGLDHLRSNYIGDYFQPGSNNTSLGGVMVATDGYVSGIVDWGTDNCSSNGFPAPAYGGSATFMMLPLKGRDFSIPRLQRCLGPDVAAGALRASFGPANETRDLRRALDVIASFAA